MLALYRSGRQSDALDVYRRTRDRLVADFGIEPGRGLHDLERAILNQDPSLELATGAATRPDAAPDQLVLVLPSGDDRLEPLLEVAESLARRPGRALLIARLLADEALLTSTVAALSVRRATLEVEAQTAAFTTVDPVGDAVRLATAYDVRLVVIDASGLDADAVPDAVTAFIERSPADVGLLAGSVDWSLGDGVCVPFGGSEHDWAALELGAWLASSRGFRSGSSGCGPTTDPADETRAACWPTPRSRYSGPSGSMRCRSSSTATSRARRGRAARDDRDRGPAGELASRGTRPDTPSARAWRSADDARSFRAATEWPGARRQPIPLHLDDRDTERDAGVELDAGCLDRGDEVGPGLLVRLPRVDRSSSIERDHGDGSLILGREEQVPADDVRADPFPVRGDRVG